jgi:hypothetical protein
MLVLLIEGIYEVRHWGGFVWHDIHSKFHEDWFRLSSNIKVLPLWFQWLWCSYYRSKGFLKCAFETRSGGAIYMQSFTKIGTGVQAILRCYLGSLNGCHVGIIDMMDSWWTLLKWAQIYLSFMKIGVGVQVALRVCFRNLRDFNVGITDLKDLWSSSLRWAKMSRYTSKFNKYWFSHSKIVGIYRHRQQGDLISQLLFFKNKENII